MKKFIITEDERSRILGMHKTATSRHYLNEQVTLSADTVDELWRHVVRKVGDSKWTSIVDSTPERAGAAFIGDRNGKSIHAFKDSDKFGFYVKPVKGYTETEEDKKLSDEVKSLVDTLGLRNREESDKYPKMNLYPYAFRYDDLDVSYVDKVVELINKLIPILNL